MSDVSNTYKQPIKYDPYEFWGDMNHLVQPVVGMMRVHKRDPDGYPMDIDYMTERLMLALRLADLALSEGHSMNAVDLELLRDGRADTGCGFFTHETDEAKERIQERYKQRKSGVDA